MRSHLGMESGLISYQENISIRGKTVFHTWNGQVLVSGALITGFPKGAPEALESRRAEDVSFGGTPL